MTLGLLITGLAIAAVAVPLLIWMVPNRRADLNRIAEVQRRRERLLEEDR